MIKYIKKLMQNVIILIFRAGSAKENAGKRPNKTNLGSLGPKPSIFRRKLNDNNVVVACGQVWWMWFSSDDHKKCS